MTADQPHEPHADDHDHEAGHDHSPFIQHHYDDAQHQFDAGKLAPRNPWGGSSLEWQAPTPPTLYNFEKPPVLHELYNYDDLIEVEEDRWERQAPTEIEPSAVAGSAHEHARPAGEPGSGGGSKP